MTKSELIERIALRLDQLPVKDVELAVKVMLDTMSDSLSQGSALRYEVLAVFHCITVHRALGGILKRGMLWRWRVNMFPISSLAKNCATE